MNPNTNAIRDQTQQPLSNWVDFLKDKNGNHSLREIVVLASLVCIIISWIAQQFFHCIMPEYMFYAFVSLIGAGCFGYSIEKTSNQNNPSNN